jgi:hypothetical protein
MESLRGVGRPSTDSDDPTPDFNFLKPKFYFSGKLSETLPKGQPIVSGRQILARRIVAILANASTVDGCVLL